MSRSQWRGVMTPTTARGRFVIELFNGCRFEFASAAGAMGFDGHDLGNGPVRAWKAPWRWCGLLDQSKFLNITKTLTLKPTKGNYRWWAPWRSCWPIRGGFVNAIGLTNKGLPWWICEVHPRLVARQERIAVSILPHTVAEAAVMATLLNAFEPFGVIKMIQLNGSCPNCPETGFSVIKDEVEHIVNLAAVIKQHAPLLPLSVKIGYQQNYKLIAMRLAERGLVDALELINSVPHNMVRVGPSPLAPYGLLGGVSGSKITECAQIALRSVVELNLGIQIMSGGGVMNYEEVQYRFGQRAGAVVFGSVFPRTPWRPNRFVARWEFERMWGSIFGT